MRIVSISPKPDSLFGGVGPFVLCHEESPENKRTKFRFIT